MARSTIRTMRVHCLSYGSDCLDTMHIETRMDIGVETSYANIGTIAHITIKASNDRPLGY